MNRRRRSLAVGTALACATSLVAIGGPAESSTTTKRADPLPLLAVRAAASRVTLPKFGRRVYPNLGVFVVAGDGTFEVRENRPDYRTPITTVVKTAAGDIVLPPDATLPRLGGLPKFVRLVIKDSGGHVVVDRATRFCPSGESVRVRPDAPDVSTFPLDCAYNPFSLGAVFGIDPGFGVPAVNPYGRGLELARGRYTASVSIAPTYQSLLGLPPETSSATIHLRVVKGDGCFSEGMHPAARARGCKSGGEARSGASSNRLATPAAHAPTAAPTLAPEPATTPDLRSLPAYGIGLTRNGFLRFAATVWNAGPAPLVVDGFRSSTDQDLMDAYQYFYELDGTPAGYANVGGMEWDDRHGHHHWHFEDFARYRLLDADMNNVVRSRKEAFCLANTDAVDYTVEGANWRPYNTELQTACGDYSSLSVREVLLAGSGDTYYQALPGQSFNVKDLPNGIYYVSVEANPFDRLAEGDPTNNVSVRKIRLMGSAKNRSVKVFPKGLVDYN
jgi:hypothetical protein